MTATNAQRQEAFRARRKLAGLTRVEFYLPPDIAQRVRKYVARLMGKQ